MLKKVFFFFLQSIGVNNPENTNRAVFARGIDINDAFRVAQTYGNQMGLKAIPGSGDEIKKETGREFAGAPLLEEMGGTVRNIGIAVGGESSLMDRYFGGGYIDTKFLETGVSGPQPPSTPEPKDPFDPTDPVWDEAPSDPSEPFMPEQIMPGGAWANALRNIGFNTGVSRSIANQYRPALENFAGIGWAGNVDPEQFPVFANLTPDRELQSVYERALPRLNRELQPGDAPLNLARQARNIWNIKDPTPELAAYLTPDITMAANDELNPLSISGAEAANQIAQLGLTGFGRGRFGALSRYLPTAQQLVAQWGAQPVGPDTREDLRDYIQRRLTAVSR
tara:strand:+ start:72 stop:1082 length:1011 start_codon:yes stop_codon:yes gene_type:complete